MQASDYEARRSELIKMLQTYNDERINIARLTALARREADAELYPSGPDLTKDKVQTSFSSSAMGESMIIRASTARKHLQEALGNLSGKTAMLDKLLLEITKLPAYQGRVIIGLYIDGHDESKVAESMGKSEDTISGYRRAAIKRLTSAVMGEKVRTWKKQ